MERSWPSSNWSGWLKLAEPLRFDAIGQREAAVLRGLMLSDPVRARCFELLGAVAERLPPALSEETVRGNLERGVLLSLSSMIKTEESETDKTIGLAIDLAESFEKVSSLFQTAFYRLLWRLKLKGGQAAPSELAAEKELGDLLVKLPAAAESLRQHISIIPEVERVADLNPTESLMEIAEQAKEAAEGSDRLVEILMARHKSVQAAKWKGVWIEPGEKLLLMPGFGVPDRKPQLMEGYMHAFRVQNARSFYFELDFSASEVPHGER